MYYQSVSEHLKLKKNEILQPYLFVVSIETYSQLNLVHFVKVILYVLDPGCLPSFR